MPQERIEECEAFFETRIEPALRASGVAGFIGPSERKAATGYFAKLVEIAPEVSIEEFLSRTERNPAFLQILQEFKQQFWPGQGASSGLISYFGLLSAPAVEWSETSAGPGSPHWRSFDELDGLTHEDVWYLMEDYAGSIWMGTLASGVSIYNGESFRGLGAHEDAVGSISAIALDSTGSVWLGTWRNGLFRIAEGSLSRFATEEGLPSHQIRALAVDAEGFVWAGTDKGLCRFDGERWSPIALEKGLPHPVVQSMAAAPDGAVWMATQLGMARIRGDSLFTVDFPDAFRGHLVPAMVCRGDEVWVASYGGGLSRFLDGQWQVLTQKDGLPDDQVWTLAEDRRGSMWAGTNAGLARYDGTGMRTFSQVDGLAGDYVRSLLTDREGHLWVGTRTGVSRGDPESMAVYRQADGLPGERIGALYRDRKGVLWFGAGGITAFDGRRFATIAGSESFGVMGFYEDRAGNLWLRVYYRNSHGVLKYDGRRLTGYDIADGLSDPWVHAIVEASGGTIWFATQNGLCALAGPSISRIEGHPWVEDGAVNSLLKDDSGVIWVGTERGLLKYVRGEWQEVLDGANDANLKGAAFRLQNPDGSFWLSRGGNLIHLNAGNVTVYGEEEGLVAKQITDVAVDDRGHLWVASTSSGVFRFDGNVFQSMDRRDGLPSNDVGSVLADGDGTVWLGTSKGLVRYRRPESVPPVVRLDAISADRRYEHPEAVTFSTSTTLAAFEFSGTNQKTRPDGMVYRYRLKGHDAAWTTTRRHRVEYERIPRGEYVFEVQGVDRDLIYSETPAQVLVTVRLPYERFAWMGLLVLSAFMIGWQAVRLVSRDRRLRQEMAERERAEAERAKLDVELHEYQYLYRLRTALGESRTLDRVADAVGTCLMDVLKAGGSGGVRIRLDDRTWEYGDPEGRYSYQRELKWGETPRGTLEVSASAALLEPQQKALLDETAGQLCTVLEAREYEMQLLQSSRLISLGEMASAVAHEFNQPLSAISTTVGDIYLRIVEGTRLPQEQLKGMMVNALNLVRRLSDTVDHLRMFSRDSSEEALAAVSLNKAIEGACSIISAQLAARGHSCRLDVQENLPPVRGNLHQLEQVFLNLLANARDALDERYGGGGGRIEAVTRFDGDVVAEVRDDGIGMTADQARRIFDPFYTTKGPDRGTGLGLSITYSIIRTHKGSISCDTEPGMGTRFTIRLPPAGEV